MPRFVAIALLLFAGCTGSKLGGACARNSDCISGYCTQLGTCALAPVDGGAGDGRATDASTKIPGLDGGIDDAPADAEIDAI